MEDIWLVYFNWNHGGCDEVLFSYAVKAKTEEEALSRVENVVDDWYKKDHNYIMKIEKMLEKDQLIKLVSTEDIIN